MSELKTKPTDQKAEDFLKTIEPEQKRLDSFALLEMFKKVTGLNPRMWGAAIIGFGMFHYKSERSTQEGDWPLVGFSPRKANLTLYLMNSFEGSDDLFKKLGKYKTSKACLYINKLSDIDMKIVAKLIEKSYKLTKNIYK